MNRLHTAQEARFDSLLAEQMHKEPCSVGTREGVLADIKDWVMSMDDKREQIFWLNGLAGTGKSTIATTIASWAREKKILGGSFFFARDVEKLNSPVLVFRDTRFATRSIRLGIQTSSLRRTPGGQRCRVGEVSHPV